MNWLTTLWGNPDSVGHILLIYSLVITIGVALGRIRIFGISLGVTFVLFAGLLASYLGFKINPSVLSFLRDFGLILFVFFIGLQVGPAFFSSFKSGGVQLNLLALLAVVLSLVVTVAIFFLLGGSVDLPQMLGVYFGAVTNTPGLGATQEALSSVGYKGPDIAIAYACAYPFAVIGIIFSAIILRRIFRINLADEDRAWDEEEKEHQNGPIFFHVEITNKALEGQTIRKIRDFINRPFICSRLLHNGEVMSPRAETVVHAGDIMRIVAAEDHKEAIVAFCGKEAAEKMIEIASSPITTRLIRVTRTEVNGLPVNDLHLSRMDGVNITRVFRSGMTLFPYQQLRLQLGDVVYCVGPERSIGRLADKLGNEERKLDHPNIVSIFLGIALGILIGSLPILVPGMPVPLKLGLAGGPLIVAILIGYLGPRFRLVTYTTYSANLMVRELGISLFLASVGLAAGDQFVAALSDGDGLLYAFCGIFITMIPLLVVGIIGRKVYKMNYHTIVGLVAGATTDPPALAYANTLSERNVSAIAYSTVYPLSMFLRILSGQIILLLLWAYVS
jgi:putative transport protein